MKLRLSDFAQRTVDELAPLFARARREGLCFHSKDGSAAFTPDELAREIERGRYIRGARC